ncbi:MAG: flagellar basal body-associated FliL family protein [Selenomonadaceae bacterium]|jgi:flagellar FliL protein|nr:flagellar basal body-associated FliL family protein [Selenomonadaceae bacterium]
MAEEDKSKDGAPEEQPPKKKSPIILVVVLVLVGLVLAGGISFFVTTKMMSNTASTDGAAHHDPGVFIKVGDPKEGILVNVGNQKQSKFLKTSIVLELNPGKKDNVADNKLTQPAETKILDTTMDFLRKAPLDDFSAAKQDELKKNLKDALNDKLGQGSVYDVYITSFLLQ